MSSTGYDYRLISFFGMIIQIVLLTVGLAIAIAGWRKQRNFGFILIAAWACAGIGWRLVQSPWAAFLQRFFSTTVTAPNMNRYMLFSNIAAGAVIQCLLLSGLALLVFQRGPSRPLSNDPKDSQL